MKRKLPWMKSAILSKRHSESKKQLPKKTVVPQVQHQFAEKTIVEPRGAPTPPVGPLEEETQTDLPALSLSCSSPLGTAVSSQPPPSLSSHLDLPTQYDGLSSPPFDLSPSASPSSPASAAASPTVIPSSSSTPNTTPTPSRRQHKLISQPTQIDLYLSQPSQDQSPPCDGGNRFSESDSLSCSPIELLDRATQLDCGSPIQKVPRTARSPRGSPRSATRSPRRRMASAQKTGAANSLTPTRGGLSAGSQAACVEQLLEEEDSLETSLLLLDTSTQDDALDALDYFQNEDGVYDSEREDDGDENGGGYECTNLISIKTRSENKKGSSPDRPTQDDRLSLSFSSQIDDMQADQLATRMKPESESLSSIPTQSDSFPLLGSAPTNIDDIPTQIDTNTTLTQIDSIPTQSDLPYECSQQHGKEKAKNTSTIIDAPTLADAFDIVDEPTPPLEGDFTGTPQLVQSKKCLKMQLRLALLNIKHTEKADARCKKGPGSDGKVSKTKRSNQKQQQKANSTKQKRNEENQSKSGTGLALIETRSCSSLIS